MDWRVLTENHKTRPKSGSKAGSRSRPKPGSPYIAFQKSWIFETKPVFLRSPQKGCFRSFLAFFCVPHPPLKKLKNLKKGPSLLAHGYPEKGPTLLAHYVHVFFKPIKAPPGSCLLAHRVCVVLPFILTPRNGKGEHLYKAWLCIVEQKKGATQQSGKRVTSSGPGPYRRQPWGIVCDYALAFQ